MLNVDCVYIKMWELPSQWDSFKANWCLNISHKKLYKKTLCATGGCFLRGAGEKAPCVNIGQQRDKGAVILQREIWDSGLFNHNLISLTVYDKLGISL